MFAVLYDTLYVLNFTIFMRQYVMRRYFFAILIGENGKKGKSIKFRKSVFPIILFSKENLGYKSPFYTNWNKLRRL